MDASATVKASYSYDAFGNLTSSSETLANGWSNPYRYDGAQGVRYDTETGLYWMSVRAYDPTLGRFISHDPLGRLAAMGLDTQPYVYAGNNPVNNTDPSGMFCACNNTGSDGHSPSWWANHPSATDIDCHNCGWSGKTQIDCLKYKDVPSEQLEGALEGLGATFPQVLTCRNFISWYQRGAALQRAAVGRVLGDAANGYIYGGFTALASDAALLWADNLPYEWVFDLLSIFYDALPILHGFALKGNHSLDWLASIINSGIHLLTGVARFIQWALHITLFFVCITCLIDGAISATPLGMFKANSQGDIEPRGPICLCYQPYPLG